MMNKVSAKNLIDKTRKNGKYALPDNMPHQADKFLYKICNTYCYKYPYFVYSTDNDSLIHPSHVDFHNQSKTRIMNYYKYGIFDIDVFIQRLLICFIVVFIAIFIFVMIRFKKRGFLRVFYRKKR
jgi:hypothetical protein